MGFRAYDKRSADHERCSQPRMAFQVLARTSHGYRPRIYWEALCCYGSSRILLYTYTFQILSKGKLPNRGKKQAFIVGLAVNSPWCCQNLSWNLLSDLRYTEKSRISSFLFVPKKSMTKFVRNIMMALSWNHKFIWNRGTPNPDYFPLRCRCVRK